MSGLAQTIIQTYIESQMVLHPQLKGADMNLLQTSEAARILNRSAEMVRVYERKGKLPAMKISGGQRLFREADVRKLAAELESKNPDRAA